MPLRVFFKTIPGKANPVGYNQWTGPGPQSLNGALRNAEEGYESLSDSISSMDDVMEGGGDSAGSAEEIAEQLRDAQSEIAGVVDRLDLIESGDDLNDHFEAFSESYERLTNVEATLSEAYSSAASSGRGGEHADKFNAVKETCVTTIGHVARSKAELAVLMAVLNGQKSLRLDRMERDRRDIQSVIEWMRGKLPNRYGRVPSVDFGNDDEVVGLGGFLDTLAKVDNGQGDIGEVKDSAFWGTVARRVLKLVKRFTKDVVALRAGGKRIQVCSTGKAKGGNDVPHIASKFIGRTVFWKTAEGERVAGVVQAKQGDSSYQVRMAIPNEDGILLVTDSEVTVQEKHLELFNGVSEEVKIRRFDATSLLEYEGVKSRAIINEDKVPIDYLDVSFGGYASTFAEVTPADRDGDYIMPGAFSKTIREFLRNPVMLIDHRNSVREIAGSYSKLTQTRQGLLVEGELSNAPGLRDVRFLVAEKHLKTLSIGGIFFYDTDGRGVREVNLFEISLVAVPANPDAIFQVRSISVEDAVKAYKKVLPTLKKKDLK